MNARLGIDAGTSMVKAVVFDDDGAALAVRSRSLGLQHGPDGAVEQDLDEVLERIGEVTREVVEAAGRTPTLVALTGQGDGCWLTDDRHRAVRPAMSWLDGRAGGIVDRWARDGVVEAVYRCNGTTLFPGAPAPLLAWLDEHDPAALDRAATAGYCKDAAFARLTGLRVTDPSDSSMPFGDGTGTGYSAATLELTGLAHRADLLAPIAVPLPLGALLPAGSELTGVAVGTPVASGPFDFPACAHGAGVTRPGDALLIIGTTLGALVLTDRIDTTGDPAGFHVATGRPGRWLRAMPAMAGTAALDWVLGVLGLGVGSVDAALAASPPGAGGVEVLPYLAPSGERAPFVDPDAAGQFTGLRLTTTPDDLVRAVCEGLAYAARHCFERAGLDGRVFVCGGGTGSRPWMQVFADVLGAPLQVARAPEVGARGAVISAAAALGDELDLAAWTRSPGSIEPDPAQTRRYDDGYRRYLAHLDAARPQWRRHGTTRTPEPGR